jgi:hypothetical protein
MKKVNLSLPVMFLLLLNIFFGCNLKDLEDQIPSNFIEKNFLRIGELPELKDEKLDIVQPNMPVVITPQIFIRMVKNLEIAPKPSDLNGEIDTMISLFRDLDGFSSPYVRQNMLNTVENLKESDLTLVYFGNSKLDNLFTEIVKSAMKNPVFLNLFPSITHPETLTVSRVLEVTKPAPVIMSGNSSKSGRCADAAKDALDRAIKRLESKRDEQLNTVEVNFQLRLEDANQRFELRNKDAEKKYLDNLRESGLEVAKMLKAAERLGKNDPALGEELKLLALIYAHSWQMIYREEFEASLTLNELARENEINEAKTRRRQLESEIIQNYNKELLNAITVLERVLAACHNQGEGN